MTGPDLEAAAADSVRDFFRRKPEPFTRKGEPCANCGTPLEGHYCFECGQSSDTHHRSLPHLIWEAIEGMFHLDGRLARTAPLLFFKPGVLAKDYMEGRIARHVPPFRTFLVALLLFIFAAEHAIHGMQHKAEEALKVRAESLTTQGGRTKEAERMRIVAGTARDQAKENLDENLKDELGDLDANKAAAQAKHDKGMAIVMAAYGREIAKADALEHDPQAAEKALEASEHPGKSAAQQITAIASDPMLGDDLKDARINLPVKPPPGKSTASWMKAQVVKALENPEYYFMVMFGWAHRLAVLLLPIVGFSLALVYVGRRQFYMYDHLLVATNLLSFAFLTNALGMVLPASAAGVWFLILVFWTPINLFQTLRGGYGSSIIGAAIKTLIVWFVSVTAFSTLLVMLIIFTLSQI